MCSDSARNHFRRELYLLLPLSIEAETEAAAEAEAEAETTADAKVFFFFLLIGLIKLARRCNRLACSDKTSE